MIAAGAGALWAATAVALASGGAAAPGGPLPPVDDRPMCDEDAASRPPDPRCGESLDGRAPAGPVGSLAVPRYALHLPRLATRAVFWPMVQTSGFLEQHEVLPWLRAILTTDDKLIGLRPDIQYSTGFLPTGGFHLFDRRLPLPGSELVATFRTAGPVATLGELSVAGPEWLGLSLRSAWSLRRDRLFAGIGPRTAAELTAEGLGASRYGAQALAGEARWTRRLPGWLVVGLHGDVQWRTYDAARVSGGPSIAELYGAPPLVCAQLGLPTGCVNPSLAPGFQRGLRMAHGGLALAFDRRSRARDGGGISVALDGTVGQGISGDPSRDARASAEIVLAVGGDDRALLLRGQAAAVEAVAAGPVPFEELLSPAGVGGLRGFPDGRFRGQSALVGTAEYRWFVAYNIDASLFTDAGTVAGARFAGIARGPFFPDFGVGLRFYPAPQDRYWTSAAGSGVQLVYAPDAGLRVLLALAPY